MTAENTATMLYHPRPVETPFSYPQFIPDPPLERAALKEIFARSTSISASQGGPSVATATVVRRPYAGQIIEVPLPNDANVVLSFKKVGVAENIQRQNLNSKIRYIASDETGEMASERDFPMGDLQLKTLMLSLVDWNITDDQERKIPLNERTVTEYLSPSEFSFAYGKVLELNPIWGGGEDEEKNA